MSRTLGWIGCCCAATACASSLPAPEAAEHPLKAYSEVPYPPAAALVEVVSRRPPSRPERGELVWIDGHWTWRGTEYSWRRGGWVIAPPDSRFAAWNVFIAEDGRILFAESAWYDAQGLRLRGPKIILPAEIPRNVFTPEAQAAR
jgi:hypothetical protein